MTLKEYIDQRISDLKRFQEDWIMGSEENPEQYPLELEEGDWYEQEISWNALMNDSHE